MNINFSRGKKLIRSPLDGNEALRARWNGKDLEEVKELKYLRSTLSEVDQIGETQIKPVMIGELRQLIKEDLNRRLFEWDVSFFIDKFKVLTGSVYFIFILSHGQLGQVSVMYM